MGKLSSGIYAIGRLAPDVVKRWSALDALTKLLIVVSLLLVLFAYLPTLQFNFLPGDQGRAFRHAEAFSLSNRLRICANSVPFFVRSGRPLVWVGECVEQVVVGKISDFTYLRPIALAIVLVSVLYLGKILAPLLGGFGLAVPVASLFAFLPGYAFMYFRGLNGGTVLLSLLPALASFSALNRSLNASENIDVRSVSAASVWPLTLFGLACLIYPAWAFVVVILSLLYLGLDTSQPINRRAKRFVACLLVYSIGSILYFAAVKLVIATNFFRTSALNMGDGRYELAPVLNPKELVERLIVGAKFIIGEPVFIFNSNHVLLALGLLAFSGCLGYQIGTHDKRRIGSSLFWTIGAFLITLVIMAGSITPWLFSHEPDTAPRFFLIVHLFSIVSIAGAISILARAYAVNTPRLAAFFALILVVAAADQSKKSFLEVTVSGIEIDYMRAKLGAWLDNQGYINSRLIVIVLPRTQRPAYIQRLLGDSDIGTAATWSGDPNHFFELALALLRERKDHPVGRSIGLVDCGVDESCVKQNLTGVHDKVVFSLLNTMKNPGTPIGTVQTPM
jgi:hypothetical protein